MARRGRNSGSMFWIAALSSGCIAAVLGWGLTKVGLGHGTAVQVGGVTWLILIIPFWVMFHNINEDDRASRAVDREERRAKERSRRGGEARPRRASQATQQKPPARRAPAGAPVAARTPLDSAIPCGACQTPLPASARFCHHCGARNLPRSPTESVESDPEWEAERRRLVAPPWASATTPPADRPSG